MIRQVGGIVKIRGPLLVMALMCLLAAAPPLGAEDGQIPPYRVLVFAPQIANYQARSPHVERLKNDLESRWPGGRVELRHFPPEALTRPELVSRTLMELADDARLRGLVLGEAPVGCLEGLARLRARRPDLQVIVIDPYESIDSMGKTAGLTLTLDHQARGLLYPALAQRMGADTLVYLSFHRHLNLPGFGQQYRVLNQAARDLALTLVSDLNAPDPESPSHSQQDIAAWLDQAVEKHLAQHGPNTAFAATSTAHSDLLTPIILRRGGILLPAAQSSLFPAYPEALGMAEEAENLFGRWPEMLAAVDEKYMALDPPGRFAVWAAPYPHTLMLAMTDLTVAAVENQEDIYSRANLDRALNRYAPSIKWRISGRMDYLQDRPTPQTLMLLQDSYWLGQGYQGLTELHVPAKYYRIK